MPTGGHSIIRVDFDKSEIQVWVPTGGGFKHANKRYFKSEKAFWARFGGRGACVTAAHAAVWRRGVVAAGQAARITC